MLHCHLLIHAEIYIYMLDTYRRHVKDAGRLLYKNIYLSLYCKGSKGLFKVCVWEGVGDRTETVIFWPPLLWSSTLCLSRSLMLNRRPRAHSTWWWFSLLHLISIFSGPQFIRASSPFGLVWLSLLLSSPTVCNSTRRRTQLAWLLSWLSYIIVQRPLDRPRDLWKRMFNRHQAEITVMQFTGHSLPVHQSMSVPWEFFSSSHFISQFPPTRFPLIPAIIMCHLLPVHHLGMAFLAGSKGQNRTTIAKM